MTRTSDPGCYSASTAYAKYYKLDKHMDENMQIYSRQYKQLAYSSAILSTISNQRFVTAIGSTKFILDTDWGNSKYLIEYRWGW